MTGWIVAAAELRIPRSSRFAAHRMILVIDPQRNAVRQINGLASWYDRARQCWRHKPIGYLKSDRLRGYDTRRHPQTFLPINGIALRSRAAGDAIARGSIRVLADKLSEGDVEVLLAPGLDALMMWTGFAGYSWAAAGWMASVSATTAPTPHFRTFMFLSLTPSMCAAVCAAVLSKAS